MWIEEKKISGKTGAFLKAYQKESKVILFLCTERIRLRNVNKTMYLSRDKRDNKNEHFQD